MKYGMNRHMRQTNLRITIPAFAIVVGVIVTVYKCRGSDTPPVLTPSSATTQITAAANKFISTLDQKQRSSVLYKFDDDKQRARWSNFPVAVVPRGGLSLHDMTDSQRKAAMAVLAVALSPRFRGSSGDHGRG